MYGAPSSGFSTSRLNSLLEAKPWALGRHQQFDLKQTHDSYNRSFEVINVNSQVNGKRAAWENTMAPSRTKAHSYAQSIKLQP